MRSGLPALVTAAVVAAGALLAPAAVAATTSEVLVTDTLNRTVSGGLGTASSGSTYALAPASAFAVNGNAGVISITKPGSAVTARVNGVSRADVTASVEFSVPTIPSTGGGVYNSVLVRETSGGSYLAQVRVQPDKRVLLQIIRMAGSAQTSLAHTYNLGATKPGEKLTLSLTAAGTTSVALTATLARTATPTQQVTLTAKDADATRRATAGSVVVRSYLSSSSPAQVTHFDNLKVTSPTTTTAPAPKPTATTPVPKPTATATAPAPKPTATATAPAPKPTQTTAPVVPPTTPQGGITSPITEPAWNTTGVREGSGASKIGSLNLPIPAGAIIVAAGAAAGGTGTSAKPYSSLQTAVDKSASGSTIVLRAGVYHENVTVPAGKKVTIQPAPGAPVWLDGSKGVTGWKSESGRWYVDNWTYNFESAPTYDRYAADGTSANWTWINKAYPMAAHPDMVWIGGKGLKEVGSLAQVTGDTFFVDTAAKRLYLGTNPSAGEVRASVLTKALSLRGADTVVKGIGIRGYATSVWMMGTVTVEAPGTVLEDVTVYDNATTGVFVATTDATLRRVTVARNGLMGIGGNKADRIVLDRVRALENNVERFNQSPVSGGVKLARTRGVTIKDSAFLRNIGPGVWLDESVYDMKVTGNDIVGNAGHGISLELSHQGLVADNLIQGSGGAGMKINNTGGLTIWNNTVIGGARAINIVQDSRDASNPNTPGHDPRRPIPDPTVPWLIKDISLGNNVVAASNGNCTVCVEDYSGKHSAEKLNIDVTGGVLHRTTANAPSWLIVWSRGAGNPAVYSSLTAFQSETGQGVKTLSVDGKAATASSGELLSGIGSTANMATTPASVTAVTGRSTALGAIFP